MTAKKPTSKQKTTTKEKQDKKVKESGIFFRVSSEQQDMISRLMRRYGKNKTEIILYALERLRQRNTEAPVLTSENDEKIRREIINLLNSLTTSYRLSISDQQRIDTLKAWLARRTTDQQAPTDNPKILRQVEVSNDFLDAEELLDELKFMDRQITSLRKETIQLEHSAYRKNALELITAITQSHDALVDALK